MKDEFDSFVDDSEFIIEQIEKGNDVSSMLADLKKRARTLDPETVPSTSFDPIFVSTMIEDLVNSETPSPSIPDFNEPITTKDSPTCDKRHSSKTVSRSKDPSNHETSKNRSRTSLKPQNSSFFSTPNQLLIITFTVLFLVSYYYFIILPSTCPKPIW